MRACSRDFKCSINWLESTKFDAVQVFTCPYIQSIGVMKIVEQTLRADAAKYRKTNLIL